MSVLRWTSEGSLYQNCNTSSPHSATFASRPSGNDRVVLATRRFQHNLINVFVVEFVRVIEIRTQRNMYRSREWWFSCVVFCVFFDVVAMQFESPCPQIFEYAFDNQETLHGRIRIENPSGNNVILNVQLSVGNSVQDFNGNIELAYGKSTAVDEIIAGKPLYYNVVFPTWNLFPPRITKISLNGELVCSGPPLDIKKVPVLTTINLQHTLKINSLSLASSDNSFGDRPVHDAKGHVDQNPQQQLFQLPQKDNNGGLFFNIGAVNPNFPGNPYFTIPTTQKPFFNFFTTSNAQNNPFLNFGVTTTKPLSYSPFDNPFSVQFAGKGTTTTERATPTTVSTTTTTTTAPATTTASTLANDPTLQIDVREIVNDICGKSLSTNSLIAFGASVVRGHYPWLVALYNIKQLNLEFTCGGSLVSNKHVITAGHCLRPHEKNTDIENLLIILGKYNIQRWTNDKDALMLSAEKIDVHPDYRPLSADADIAVITLSQEVRFKKFIRPICLWSEGTNLRDVVGENGIVAGWGKDENGKVLSPEPKQVTLPIVAQADCLRSHFDFADVTSNRTFCAGFRNGSGPCNGDSGGGFMMQRDGRWTLRGIVSMSLADRARNCDLSQYLVFTDVSKFLDWLLAIIKQ